MLHASGAACTDRSEEHFLACLAALAEAGNQRLEALTHLALGFVRAANGGSEGAEESLVAARDLARAAGLPGVETTGRCALACLPGGNAQDALAALAEHAERLSAEERREARLLLWRATGDRTHLAEAKRQLDDLLARNPPEYHESMRQNHRVNREILAAWRQEFGDDDEPGGAESVTRSS